MVPAVTRDTALAALAALVDTGALFDGAKVMLFKNNVSVGPEAVLSDLEVADFTGYGISSAVTYGVPYIGQDGTAEVTAGSKQFTQTDDTTTCAVYGWALVGDPAGTPFLIAGANFDEPLSMAAAGMGVVVTPTITL
jgi:hypothetical protein